MEWITVILGILGPLLAKCQQRNNPSQTQAEAQAELKSRYNAVTGQFDADLMRRVTDQVRKAESKARRQGTKADRQKPRLTPAELRELAHRKLVEAMVADRATLRAAYKAASSIEDGE